MKKNYVLMVMGILVLLVLTGNAKADIIRSGYKPIEINNYIKNIGDFPDYVFVSVSTLGGGGISGMCSPLGIIESDGKILGRGYKFCNTDVYAIEKDKFDEELISEGKNIWKYNESQLEEYNTRLMNYFSLNDVKKVISGADFYKEVPVTSTQKSIVNYYSVELSKTKTKPDEVSKERNSLIYLYIGIALTALIVIIILIVKKMRR